MRAFAYIVVLHGLVEGLLLLVCGAAQHRHGGALLVALNEAGGGVERVEGVVRAAGLVLLWELGEGLRESARHT